MNQIHWLHYRNFSVATPQLESNDEEMLQIISQAWAPSTLKTRNSQWRVYIEFCMSEGLSPLPAEVTTVCRFLVNQSRRVKYNTINNYVSAINVLHKFYSYDVNFREFYLTRFVLAGLKSELGAAVEQKHPLTIEQLIIIRRNLPETEYNLTMWAAVVFGFRTLLRKSNIVPDGPDGGEHVILRSDLQFYTDKLFVNVRSSKTNRYKERIFQIPIMKVINEWFCVYTMLQNHFLRFPVASSQPIFWKSSGQTTKPIIYSELLQFLKSVVCWVGLKPQEVGLHSLRRSGAGFLYSLGVPLSDIQSFGDWSSLAVLLYLCTPFARKCDIETSVSRYISSMSMN